VSGGWLPGPPLLAPRLDKIAWVSPHTRCLPQEKEQGLPWPRNAVNGASSEGTPAGLQGLHRERGYYPLIRAEGGRAGARLHCRRLTYGW
jgi:hypothetical protein